MVLELATLIEIITKDGNIRRFQNYCRTEYFFRGLPYKPLNFSQLPLPTQQLDYSNADIDVKLGNASGRTDALRPVREWLKATGDLSEARVVVYHIWPSDPTAPPIQAVYQVLDVEIGGSIELNWRSPVESINGIIPSVQLTQQNAGLIPRYQTQHSFQ